MDRLLLLMTSNSYQASAFLRAAQKLGIEVVIGSEAEHVLTDLNPGGHLALNFEEPEEAIDSVIAHAKSYPIRAVVSTEDDGALLAAMASDALGLPYNPVNGVAAARNKHLTRQLLAGAGLLSPWFERFPLQSDPEQLARDLEYPCVLKPLSLSASRGVIRANNPAEFTSAFRRISSILQLPEVASQQGHLSQYILVEGYIPGQEVSLEGFLTAGRLTALAIFDKPDPMEGPYFEETIYVTPSRHPKPVQDAVLEAAFEAVRALGLREGPVHAEFRINDQGPWALEIAPRAIGGHCGRALRFDGNLSLEELILQHAIGNLPDIPGRERSASGVMMIPIPRGGTLRGIEGQASAAQVPWVEEIILELRPGARVVPPPEGNRYLGFIFARANQPDQVEQALRMAHAELKFKIE